MGDQQKQTGGQTPQTGQPGQGRTSQPGSGSSQPQNPTPTNMPSTPTGGTVAPNTGQPRTEPKR